MPRGLRYAQSLARVHHVGCDRLRRIVAHSTNLDCRTNARLETMIVRTPRMRNLASVAPPLSLSLLSVGCCGRACDVHGGPSHETPVRRSRGARERRRAAEHRRGPIFVSLERHDRTREMRRRRLRAFAAGNASTPKKEKKEKKRKSKKRRQAVTNIKWPTARCRPKCRRNDVVVVSV